MLRVYDCLVSEHDLRMVAAAAAICALSSFVALYLYSRARASAGKARLVLAGTLGFVVGLGTWSTHFVAMLAFQPSLALGYEPRITIVSLVVAIGIMGSGALLAVTVDRADGRLIGGALVGVGVSVMHYTGMRALLVPGSIEWDAAVVAASIIIGMTLAFPVFAIAGDGARPTRCAVAAFLLTIAIAGLHFTGMAAVGIRFDPVVTVPSNGVSSNILAVGVAAGTALVLVIGAASIVIGWRARRGEAVRLRAFADAAVEGLVICVDGIITDANAAFCAMAGEPVEALVGQGFQGLFCQDTQRKLATLSAGLAVEGLLPRANGDMTSVAIITREFAGADGRLRTVYAVRDLREQKEAERRIRFLAHHDPLTGLPNRVTFTGALEAALEAARTGGAGVAVLCIDLDHFKAINDLHGHFSGDAVLVEAARRMTAVLGERDVLARLGGDEFAVVQSPAASQPETAIALAERLNAALADPIEVAGGNRVAPGGSIGIAIGSADDLDAERLMAHADTALYRAKSDGRGCFRCFEPEMGAQVRERHALALDLRQAIERGELTLFYQPQVKSSTGEPIGFEALVRWNHPVRGLVSPGDFISIAEESGLIISLGEWVLRTACAEAARWTQPLKVAVNLSPVQFQQAHLPEVVHAILMETGLPPSRLELEVTETVLISDMSRALSLLRRLKSLGVSIAMDDFGTGYSSLATLQAFQFDKIKIDQSFVSKIETHHQAALIVRAVVGLGRSLGVGVVAEGVETADQARFLEQESCEDVQGYLFGRPQPIESFAHCVYGGAKPGEGAARAA